MTFCTAVAGAGLTSARAGAVNAGMAPDLFTPQDAAVLLELRALLDQRTLSREELPLAFVRAGLLDSPAVRARRQPAQPLARA